MAESSGESSESGAGNEAIEKAAAARQELNAPTEPEAQPNEAMDAAATQDAAPAQIDPAPGCIDPGEVQDAVDQSFDPDKLDSAAAIMADGLDPAANMEDQLADPDSLLDRGRALDSEHTDRIESSPGPEGWSLDEVLESAETLSVQDARENMSTDPLNEAKGFEMPEVPEFAPEVGPTNLYEQRAEDFRAKAAEFTSATDSSGAAGAGFANPWLMEDSGGDGGDGGDGVTGVLGTASAATSVAQRMPPETSVARRTRALHRVAVPTLRRAAIPPRRISRPRRTSRRMPTRASPRTSFRTSNPRRSTRLRPRAWVLIALKMTARI